MDVFLLWHVHELPGGEDDAELIGVYSSQESAARAQQRAAARPGFREAPDGFCIDRYTVDQDCWVEGYVTDTHEDIVRRWQAEAGEPAAAPDRPRD
jgi:hypothetical protein